ncbi:MAG: hypothetical protein CR968_02230 [Flavobacteriia bacterium]|nr:MAG: hypothetical protein CR968_02230 [Flavobacteriia bacterium]
MMSKFKVFFRRLSYFLLGLIIGIFILKRIYNKKNATFDYMPNARTLKSINAKPIIYFSNEAKTRLKESGIDSVEAMRLLKDGNVNFGKSHQHQKPCAEFFIEPTAKTPDLSLVVERCDSVSVIKSIIIN